MSNEVILTCAVSGGHNNQARHPDYPITPEHIARDCIEAARVGAAIVHIHVRDPETGMRSGDAALFREVVERIRDSGSDVLINLTTSEGARFSPGDVDAAVGVDHLFHQSLHSGCVAHIGDVGRHFGAARFDFLCHRIQRFLANIHQSQVAARVCQLKGQAASDSTTCTGDKDNLVS